MDPLQLRRIGPYLVRRFVAEGGMAWVFEVADPKFEGRRLALKMLKPDAAAGHEFERFIGEAALLAEIDHPNLVTVFDAARDEETDCFYYTMTFVDGPPLSERLARGPLGLDEARSVFLSLLDGLAALHERGVVHRDIKPGNVMLGRDGRTRLGDLGIARVEQDAGRTRTGFAVGTVMYMSPEQARGQRVDTSSDVCSVGLTLFEALTGSRVYDNVEDLDSSSNHEILGYLVSLGRTGQEIEIRYPPEATPPHAVREVIETACRLRPEERYRDARAMRDALEEALRPAAAQRPASRWPWIALGAASLVVALAAFYLLYWLPASVAAKDEQAIALEQRVMPLLERAKGLSPALAKEPLARCDASFESAHQHLVDGRRDRAGGLLLSPRARDGYENAIAGYTDVCRQLNDGGLEKRATDRMGAVTRRAGEIRADASKHAPDSWKQIEASLAAPGAVAGDDACAATEAYLDRLAVAEQTLARVSSLEDELAERLAATARNEALAREGEARKQRVGAPEYDRAVQAGELALKSGERARQEREFPTARDAYRAAARHFEKAAQIVPAAKARDDVRRLEEIERNRGIASAIIAKADDLYRSERWKEAEADYREAEKILAKRQPIPTLPPQKPPEIVRRTPEPERVEVGKRAKVVFSVEAKDPNAEDRLAYAWSLDGEPLAAKGASLELRPERGGRVTVSVTDGHGASPSASWTIVLANQAPTLTLQPAGESVSVAEGEKQGFRAKASDPDGGEVSIVFRLDGKQVASGPLYEFTASQPGTHELLVVATDAGGEARSVRRRIEVPARVARVSPPTTIPHEPPPDDPTDPTQGVHRALARYESCLESKKMECLTNVWITLLQPEYKLYRFRFEKLFRDDRPLEVSIALQSVEPDGDQVTVVFEQSESSWASQEPKRYRAVLRKRKTTNEWQMTENKLVGD